MDGDTLRVEILEINGSGITGSRKEVSRVNDHFETPLILNPLRVQYRT